MTDQSIPPIDLTIFVLTHCRKLPVDYQTIERAMPVGDAFLE